MIKLHVNGQPRELDGVDPQTPLLWVLRDTLGLTGTKYGCGMNQCGACSVHVDGRLVRSCVMPISALAGAKVTTIEGLSADGSHPLQKAWKAHGVRNAVTARRVRSWPPRRCWPTNLPPPMRTSTPA